jgi:hypothetical protein
MPIRELVKKQSQNILSLFEFTWKIDVTRENMIATFFLSLITIFAKIFFRHNQQDNFSYFVTIQLFSS